VLDQSAWPRVRRRLTTGVGAQQRTTPQAASGPSLAETKAWLETDATALLGGSGSQHERGESPRREKHVLSALALDNCVLSWTDTWDWTAYGQSQHRVLEKRVPLKDLDVNYTKSAFDEQTDANDRLFWVALKTNAAAGAVGTVIPVMDAAAGDRVATAIRRATVLCGAKASTF
jgi:hypothetical protein